MHGIPGAAGSSSAAGANIRGSIADADDADAQFSSGAGVRRMSQAVSRCAAANALARARYPSVPERFADTELALHAAVRALGPLATQPRFYGDAVAVGLVPALTDLLAHDNLDIVADVVSLLADLVDSDAENDERPYLELNVAMVDACVFQALLIVLSERLVVADIQKVEETGVHEDDEDKDVIESTALAALSVFENVLELQPEMSGKLGGECGLVQFCVTDVALCSDYSERRASVLELLALLLQAEQKNRTVFGTCGGVDLMLRAVAQYHKSSCSKKLHRDEAEMAANMFGVLCAALLDSPTNKDNFASAEGVQLMLLFVRKRKDLRVPALKLLDFACTDSSANVGKFFKAGGVGVLFGVFMTLWVSTEHDGTRARGTASSEVEHVMALLFSLFRCADADGKERLASKFLEAEGAKARRLLVLYAERLESASDAFHGGDHDVGEESAAETEGQFVLQLCAVVIAHVSVTGPDVLTAALRLGLADVGGLGVVGSLVQRYAVNFSTAPGEDATSSTKATEEHERLVTLANALRALDS
jgi:beta-catenin-like protein 1